MKNSKTIARKSNKNIRGQGMSEYLIIVALIAVAGIAVMGLFGGAARNQVAVMASEIAGNTEAEAADARTAADTRADVALDDSEEAVNLSNFSSGNDSIRTETVERDSARQ